MKASSTHHHHNDLMATTPPSDSKIQGIVSSRLRRQAEHASRCSIGLTQWPSASRHRSEELTSAGESPSGIRSRHRCEKVTSAAESTSASRHRREKLTSEIDGTSCHIGIADIEGEELISAWADEAHHMSREELTSDRANEAHSRTSEVIMGRRSPPDISVDSRRLHQLHLCNGNCTSHTQAHPWLHHTSSSTSCMANSSRYLLDFCLHLQFYLYILLLYM